MPRGRTEASLTITCTAGIWFSRSAGRGTCEVELREIVVHPGAVVILPILSDGRIVMVRQFRPAANAELLELPAGTREPDEAPIDTARRELEEETGYRAGRIEPFAEFFTSPGILTEKMHAFVATELHPVGQRLEAHERIEVAIMPMAELRRIMIHGDLRDGKTIAVLGLFLARAETRQ